MRRLLWFGRRKPSPERIDQAITWHKVMDQHMTDTMDGTAALKRSEYFDGTIGACVAGCWNRCVMMQDARQCPNYTLRAGVTSELDTKDPAFLADPDLDIPAKAELNPQPLPPGRVDPPLNLDQPEPAPPRARSVVHAKATLSDAIRHHQGSVQALEAKVEGLHYELGQAEKDLSAARDHLADHQDALAALGPGPGD